jgi:hypothetical protein
VDDTSEAPPYPEPVSAADTNARLWSEDWQVDLAQAIELQDLAAISALGTKALASGLVDAQPMAAQAREAWLDVQARLAGNDG